MSNPKKKNPAKRIRLDLQFSADKSGEWMKSIVNEAIKKQKEGRAQHKLSGHALAAALTEAELEVKHWKAIAEITESEKTKHKRSIHIIAWAALVAASASLIIRVVVWWLS